MTSITILASANDGDTSPSYGAEAAISLSGNSSANEMSLKVLGADEEGNSKGPALVNQLLRPRGPPNQPTQGPKPKGTETKPKPKPEPTSK